MATRFHGIESHEEVDMIARRDDARSTKKKFQDLVSSPSGTLKVFGTIAVLCVLSSPVPFLPELELLVAAFILLLGYNYKKKTWSLPFRVPRYLAEKGYKDRSTGAPGDGLVYLGASLSSRSDRMEEVWATAGDTRTHQLVVGTTGSGKTEEMMGTIFNALALGSGAVMIDGKASQNSFDSIYRICRLYGREEELFLINYIMGGKDVFGATPTKMSNTYNPFSLGSSSMKAELMNSLMPDGKKDVWSERAVSFNAAVMPLLSFLSERGYVLFNPRLLADFYSLDRLENLIWFGQVERHDGTVIDMRADAPEDFARLNLDQVSGSIKLYMRELPGYALAKPTKPHKIAASSDLQIRAALDGGPEAIKNWALEHARAQDEADGGGSGPAAGARGQKKGPPNQGAESARAKVYEQHGYITMQLVRSTALLTFEYGHVFNVEQGEINYTDVMLNRRIVYTALPSLERSPASLGALGKLAVASIKSVLASLLDTPFEGLRREIIEGRPSNSEVPFAILCDEYGYYVVEGFAVAPAQARSFGVTIKFGAQELADLKKGDPHEAEATWSNTNLRMCGRMTGGEESETWKKFAGAAGYAHVSRVASMSHRKGRIGSNFDLSAESRTEKEARLNVNDLNGQQDGQFTLVVGTKTDASKGVVLAKEANVRVVRYLAFYTGNVPKVPFYRLNHFVAPRPPTRERLAEVAAAEAMAVKMSAVQKEDIEAFLHEPGREDLRAGLGDSALAVLVGRLSELPEGIDDATAVREGLAVIRRFVQERLEAVVGERVDREIAPIQSDIGAAIASASFEEADRELLEGLLEDLLDEMRTARVASLVRQHGASARVAQARGLMAA